MGINLQSLNSWLGRNYHRIIEQAISIPILRIYSHFYKTDISIFFDFKKPPYGGGNQFLLALRNELTNRKYKLEINSISQTARVCLFNNHNFSYKKLKSLRTKNCRMVHRVDGPLTFYRGHDDGTDQKIWNINQELADITIFQSHYSLQKYSDMGLIFKSAYVITNSVNPKIFYPMNRIKFDPQNKIRLVSTSWSDNPNKGFSIYKWLDQHLDWQRFQYTFIGNSPINFQNIRIISPVKSIELAEILRKNDLYITASKNDPCSNALIEALSCGLPSIYLQSGGHSEIVKEAGLGFKSETEIPNLLEDILKNYEHFREKISIPSISEITDRYLEAMGVRSVLS